MSWGLKPAGENWVHSFCRTILRVVTSVFFDLKVTGQENVPSEGGVLLLVNHQSFLDPPCVGVQMKRPLSYLAKSELFEAPFFGKLIPLLNAYPVRQGAGDVGAVRETIKRLKEGHILTVFPEGSRTPDGEMLPLQPGFALVVRKAGVPIIPVAINGTYRAWPKGKMFFTPTPVRVKFGKPLDIGHLKADQMVPIVEREIRKLLDELKAEMHAESMRNQRGHL